MNVRATLLDEDIARQHKLAVCALHTKTLGLGVTAVLGGTHSFFMCEQLNIYLQHTLHLHITYIDIF